MSKISGNRGGFPSSAPLGEAGDGFALKSAEKTGGDSGSSTSSPPSSPSALEGLGPRISELRRSNKLTQVEVAHRMGTTQPALARLEKGEAKPNLRTLSRYAEAIGQRVTVAFSRSQPDGSVNKIAEASDLEAIPKVLSDVRRKMGITQVDIAARMEITQPVIARLENGGAPNLRTLERYSDAMGVNIDIAFSPIAKAAMPAAG